MTARDASIPRARPGAAGAESAAGAASGASGARGAGGASGARAAGAAGAATARRDASEAPPADAAVELADAAVATAGDADASGTIVVTNDVWCDVAIDGAAAGRKSPGKSLELRVAAGHHVVTCAQPGTDRVWTRDVDLAPGGRAPASGKLLPDVTVRFEVDAALDGVKHAAGTHVIVPANVHQLEANGAHMYADIKASCVVRDRPQLDCYR
jgi:hypothetical protein